jgi:2-dehydropantoate 2-reductase|eukprot:g4028.t1
MPPSSKLHILGAGAIGRVFANRIARSGADVSLLLRSQRVKQLEQAGKITEHESSPRVELEVENLLWEQQGLDSFEKTVVQFERVLDEGKTDCRPEEQDAITTVLVVTKANDAQSALKSISSRLAKDSIIMLLCNGSLALEEELASHGEFSNSYLVSGVTMQGAFRRPGEPHEKALTAVDAGGHGACWFGLSNEGRGYSEVATGRYKEALAIMNGASLKTTDETPGNLIRRRLWTKLGVNCVMNAFTGVLACPNGVFLSTPTSLKALQGVCNEVAAASRLDPACSPPLDGTELSEYIVNTVNRANNSSMYQDVMAGRRTEIDYINGWISSKAADGLDAKYNGLLTNLIKMKEEISCAAE